MVRSNHCLINNNGEMIRGGRNQSKITKLFELFRINIFEFGDKWFDIFVEK